jgi:nitrogen-specific signal transduction histidine kinase
VQDVTDAVVAEEERRALEAQLRQSQKMEAMGTLAGGVAHDFNNILAAIIGNADLAALHLEEEHPSREAVEEIQKAGLRAKELVRQILLFSRKQDHRRSPQRLHTLVQETVNLLRVSVPPTVTLRMETDEAAPEALVDANQIHQVLMNLGTNAWQALDGDTGTVTVVHDAVVVSRRSAALSLQPGRYVRLSVQDTGAGIGAEALGRIFEPFFTTKSPGSGTGLGLSVVQSIVEQHGGKVVVSSTPGRGSRFDVYLPVAEPAEGPAPSRDDDLPLGHGQHIVYVDDDRALVSLAKRMLGSLGFRVSPFSSPAVALAFITSGQAVDAVITDMNMPELSGLQLLQGIRARDGALPVLVTSGNVTEDLRVQVSAAGRADILEKPMSMDELAQVLRRTLSTG